MGPLAILIMTTICSQSFRAEQLTIDRPDKVLRAHGVALTKHGVVAALRSKNIEVRQAAADVLVDRWPQIAGSAIEQVMRKDPDGFTRVRMATDVARLGDTAGREALINECHNATEWGSIRMDAAGALTEEFKDDSCLDVIVGILQSDSDPRDTGAKGWALQLTPHLIGRLDREQSHKLFELVMKSLDDPWPGIRTTASMMLEQIGDAAAIPSMEAAIAKEKDVNGRLMMIRMLQVLQNKKTRQ